MIPRIIYCCPTSIEFRYLYGLLKNTLGPQEVEPWDLLVQNLTRTSDSYRHASVAVRLAGEIVAGAIGTVWKDRVAIRMVATKRTLQKTGLGRLAVNALIQAPGSPRFERTPGSVVIGECTASSEAFWNKIVAPPMCRLYRSVGGSLVEMMYCLPHFGPWASDGRPRKMAVPAPEHLQISITGGLSRIRGALLRKHVRALWDAWYVLPASDFSSGISAWRRHRQFILEETLAKKILNRIGPNETLHLMSRDARKRLVRRGAIVIDQSAQTKA